MGGMSEIITMLTSVGTESAAIEISEELVSRRLATCVNIVPCTRSIYRWKGDRICQDTELLLFIKTPAAQAAAVERAIMSMQTYELPEVMSLPNDRVEEVTRRWIIDNATTGSQERKIESD